MPQIKGYKSGALKIKPSFFRKKRKKKAVPAPSKSRRKFPKKSPTKPRRKRKAPKRKNDTPGKRFLA